MNLKNSLLLLTLMPTMGHADFFLDLGIGMHVSSWHDKPSVDSSKCIATSQRMNCHVTTIHPSNYLGDTNPLGSFAVGYERDVNKVVNISTYFEHTSSIPTKHERGLNTLMLKARVNLSELFR